MSKSAKLILIGVPACFIGMLLAALASQMLVLPQLGWIQSTELNMYVDGLEHSNGTALDWGNLTVGNSYYVNFTVANVGSTVETVYLHVEGVPSNCSETWTANGTTLNPSENATGELLFTVGMDAPLGGFIMDSWIGTD